jgi:hypothetical protein
MLRRVAVNEKFGSVQLSRFRANSRREWTLCVCAATAAAIRRNRRLSGGDDEKAATSHVSPPLPRPLLHRGSR